MINFVSHSDPTFTAPLGTTNSASCFGHPRENGPADFEAQSEQQRPEGDIIYDIDLPRAGSRKNSRRPRHCVGKGGRSHRSRFISPRLSLQV